MTIAFSIGIIIVSFAAGYFGYRAYILAGLLSDQQDYTELVELNYQYLLEKVNQSYEEMQRIDSKGAFESDDEAGTTFALLKQVINDLKETQDGTKEETE
jgi:hypothetical protein